jgi:predicted HTH transcriptional regulator
MMYIFIFLAFVSGVGMGIFSSRFFVGGRESVANPFLDEDNVDEADSLRAEGAVAVQDRIERKKKMIVAKAVAEGRITNDGVEELFCVSNNTAGRYLTQLVKENRLTKVGKTGRGVYYEPV